MNQINKLMNTRRLREMIRNSLVFQIEELDERMAEDNIKIEKMQHNMLMDV